MKQRGLAHIALIIILVAGLVAGLYLISHPQIFRPKAAVNSPSAQFVDANGNQISQTTTANVRLKIVKNSGGSSADVVNPSPTPAAAADRAPTPSPAANTVNVYTRGFTASPEIVDLLKAKQVFVTGITIPNGAAGYNVSTTDRGTIFVPHSAMIDNNGYSYWAINDISNYLNMHPHGE